MTLFSIPFELTTFYSILLLHHMNAREPYWVTKTWIILCHIILCNKVAVLFIFLILAEVNLRILLLKNDSFSILPKLSFIHLFRIFFSVIVLTDNFRFLDSKWGIINVGISAGGTSIFDSWTVWRRLCDGTTVCSVGRPLQELKENLRPWPAVELEKN